jgi:hypothetical protein
MSKLSQAGAQSTELAGVVVSTTKWTLADGFQTFPNSKPNYSRRLDLGDHYFPYPGTLVTGNSNSSCTKSVGFGDS